MQKVGTVPLKVPAICISTNGQCRIIGSFKESAYRIAVCNPHFGTLQLFQRSGTNWF